MCCALCLPTSPGVRAWLRPPAELGAGWAEPRVTVTRRSQLPEPSAGWHRGRALRLGATAVPARPHHPCAPSLHYTQGLVYPTGLCLRQRNVVLLLSSFVAPRLGQGKQQIPGCQRRWSRVPPSPDLLPRRRRAGRPGKVLAGGQRLQAAHASAGAGPSCGARVTPGGHWQLLGPRWMQAGQDGALIWRLQLGRAGKEVAAEEAAGPGLEPGGRSPAVSPFHPPVGPGQSSRLPKQTPAQTIAIINNADIVFVGVCQLLGSRGTGTPRVMLWQHLSAFISQLRSGQRWHRGWPVTSLSLSPQ